jgi:hypothetical protein
MKVLFNYNLWYTIAPQECQKYGIIDARNIVRVVNNAHTGGRIIIMRNGHKHSVLSMPLLYR